MNAFITYKEVENIVQSKANQTVKLSKGEGNTVMATYTASNKILGKTLSKDVSAAVAQHEIQGLDVNLSYSFAKAIDFVIKGVKTVLSGYIAKKGILDWGEQDNQVILHVDQICKMLKVEGVDDVSKMVNVEAIEFQDEGIAVSVKQDGRAYGCPSGKIATGKI